MCLCLCEYMCPCVWMNVCVFVWMCVCVWMCVPMFVRVRVIVDACAMLLASSKCTQEIIRVGPDRIWDFHIPYICRM